MAHVSFNSDEIFWVKDCEVNISKNDNIVYGVFTCQGFYDDSSSLLKFFNGEPTSMTLKFENPIDQDAIRTLSFVKAVCKTYSESYEHHSKDSKEYNLWITFSIEAEAVSMGEEDFPK